MTTILLIVHGLLAVALLGAITHQAYSLYPAVRPRGGVLARFGRVQDSLYTKAIVTLYLATVVLGALIYPTYRLNVRIAFEEMYLLAPIGLFELKEHFAAIGLGILPIYWSLWRPEIRNRARLAGRSITLLVAFVVWWDFLVGHILNNLRGLS